MAARWQRRMEVRGKEGVNEMNSAHTHAEKKEEGAGGGGEGN